MPSFPRCSVRSLSCALSPRMLGSSFLRAPPSPGHVHLWLLDPCKVDDPALLQAYASFLSDEEQGAIEQSASEGTRKERLLTRVLARMTLARYCSGLLDPSELEFTCNEYGKPAIGGPASMLQPGIGSSLSCLQFNLSHTRSLIACAVANSVQIGVDVEDNSRLLKTDILKLASRKFSTREAADLAEIKCAEQRQARFVELWTLKESFVKAIGKGIAAAPLNGFSFDLRPQYSLVPFIQTSAGLQSVEEPYQIDLSFQLANDLAAQKYGADPSAWSFFLMQPSPNQTLAVCVQKADECTGTNLPRLSVWETYPLLWDEPLGGDARVLGCSR